MRSTAVKEEFDEDLPVDPEGPIVLAMDWVLPGKETFAYVIEYGTYPPNEVLGAHMADNWLHAHGDLDSDQGKAIKAELSAVMYPEFDDWKTMIWDEAVDALNKSAQVLRSLSSHSQARLESALWRSPRVPCHPAHRKSDTTRAPYRP